MSPFADRVYELCARVPRGKVTTYKEIGKAMGSADSPGSSAGHSLADARSGSSGMIYRAVGVALKHNPHAPIVPCHRVVASDGSIGGFHGHTSGPFIAKKIAMLKEEGVLVKDGKIVDFEKKVYRF